MRKDAEWWQVYFRDQRLPVLVRPKKAKLVVIQTQEEQELEELQRLMRTGAEMTQKQRRRWFALSQRQDSM